MILLQHPENSSSAAEESSVTLLRAPTGPRDIQLGPRGNNLDDQVFAGRGEGADRNVCEVTQLDSVCLAGRRRVRLAGERRGGRGRLGDHGIGVELHLAWSPRSHPERGWEACGEASAWLGARGTHPPAQPSLLPAGTPRPDTWSINGSKIEMGPLVQRTRGPRLCESYITNCTRIRRKFESYISNRAEGAIPVTQPK